MAKYPLDAVVDRIQEQLQALSPKQVAAFSVCVPERLFPIYDSFVAHDNWGSSLKLRKIVDSVWESLTANNLQAEELQERLRLVEELTPDLERFDSVISAFAVDVCICIDSSIRCLMNEGVVATAVENGLGVIRKAETVKQTGCLDLGDSVEAFEFEQTIPSNSNIQDEISAQQSDLQDLRTESMMTRETVEILRQRAKSMRIDVDMLLRGLVT